jgi:predicted Zn-dependent protease
VAAVFGLALKWADRYDTARATEKYQEVIGLDAQGAAGSYTDPDTHITAPYAEHAKYAIAVMAVRGRSPDMAPVKAFIAENPNSLLAGEAYALLSRYYSRRPGEEAGRFYAAYAAAYPNDPVVLVSWLKKIVNDKGPMDKGAELAAKLRALTGSDPNPAVNLAVAQYYDLAGEKAKAEEVFGQAFLDDQIARDSNNLIAYANYWVDKKENLGSAVSAADAALKLQPESIYVLRSAASVYSSAGQEAKAMELYGPAWAAKMIAQGSDRDLSGYAQFWTRQGKNLASALTSAKKAVELQPAAYFYWSVLSDVYAKMGNRAEAIKAAEKAVEQAEGSAKAGMQRKLDGLKAAAPEKK